MSLTDSILSELEREAVTTRRVLERVPEDQLSYKPHPKSMSLGTLALHIAKIPGAIAGLASGDDLTSPPNFAPPEATGVAQILEALDESLAQAKTLLSAMDDERALSIWSMAVNGQNIMSLPRIAVLRNILLNHWYHHRGQLTVYLRLLDVPLPSVYGPSADESPFG
ncbi:MAG TPA: DinB family protein [Thermoanaerobaculia bacterium]|jgi:uncharacterized damage-inducible protein DinB|nr:DinB family protein [Thermoanaerobaculia bacterium]